MNQEDQQLVRSFIAQELKDFIPSLPDEDVIALTRRMAPEMWADIPTNALRKIKRAAPTRFLVAGADINTTVYSSTTVANQAGHAGPTLPDIINLASGFQAKLNARDEARQLDIKVQAGGGTDCMFDWLVSECWATEVAAGRGYEGKAFTSITGCTFYVTSTIQNAWDGVGDGTGAKNFTEHCTVFICPGAGIGQLAISGDSGSTILSVIFQGTNNEDSVIPGSGLTFGVTITGGSKPLVWRDLGFGCRVTTNTTADPSFKKTAGGGIMLFERCRFGRDISEGPEITGGTGAITFIECEFPTNQAGEWAMNMGGYGHYTQFIDCSFFDALNAGTECYMQGCTFDPGARAVGVVVPSAASSTTFVSQGAKFRSATGTGFTYYFQIDEPTCYFHIKGTQAASERTAVTAAVKVTSSWDNNGREVSVTENAWGCDLGLDVTGASQPMIVNYSNNSHIGTTTAAPIIARGLFANSVFESNAPARGYVDFEGVSLSTYINRINGYQIGAGAPSHTANEGQLYFDATANSYYMNTSAESGTTWAVLGVSGGGAAAPSPHNLVSAHHDGEQDYTNTLNLLDLGTEDIRLFSDAGTTATGAWDGSDGTLVIGAGLTENDITIGGVASPGLLALRVAGLTAVAPLLFTQHATSAAVGPILYQAKSRGSVTVPTVTASGDPLGGIRAHGFDGTDYEIAASIMFNQDGAAGSGDMPGRIVFSTTADGAASVTERMRISNHGGIWIANYLRVGSLSAPTNTTDGDLTATRLIVPNATILHSAINQLGGPVVIPTAGVIRFSDADDSNYVGLRSPAVAPAANLVIHLPSDTPSAGEFLKVTAISSPDITTEWAAGGAAASVSMAQVWALIGASV